MCLAVAQVPYQLHLCLRSSSAQRIVVFRVTAHNVWYNNVANNAGHQATWQLTAALCQHRLNRETSWRTKRDWILCTIPLSTFFLAKSIRSAPVGTTRGRANAGEAAGVPVLRRLDIEEGAVFSVWLGPPALCLLLSLFLAIWTDGIKFCIVVQAFCSILRSRRRCCLSSFSRACTSSRGFRGGLGSFPNFFFERKKIVKANNSLVKRARDVFWKFEGNHKFCRQHWKPTLHHEDIQTFIYFYRSMGLVVSKQLLQRFLGQAAVMEGVNHFFFSRTDWAADPFCQLWTGKLIPC